MDKKLTWLHLSDLHLTCKKSEGIDWTRTSINQDIVINSLLEAIDKLLIKKSQKLNLIFITGDLVHGGKDEEYDVAGEFCQQLLKITGLSKKQLFIVPGNHDVNRDAIRQSHIESWYKVNNLDDISDRLSNSDIFPALMCKLEGFYKFCKSFLELDIEPKQQYIFGKTIKIIGMPLEINLLGLNSALFAGYDGDDNHKLAFGLYQSQQAFHTLNENAHLSIAFFHHPFSCFHECEVPIQNQLKQKVDLIFTGHLHSPSNMSQSDSSGKTVIIGAGASYEKRESENSFNVGVLDLETGEGKVQFYKYIKNQFRWTKNTEINLDYDDDGRFPFVISSLQKKPLFIPKKFICQKINDGEFLDLSSVNHMYGYSMNSMELDKEQSVFCILHLPNAQCITPAELQNHNAIVAICICDKDKVLNELSVSSNSPISKIMKYPINKLTNEEKKEVFMAIGTVFSNSFIAAVTLPRKILEIGRNNETVILYDAMLNTLLLPILQKNKDFGMQNFNLMLPKIGHKDAKLLQTAKKITRSLYSKKGSWTVNFIEEQEDFKIIGQVSKTIAWAVNSAYNSDNDIWIKELDIVINSGDSSHMDKSPPK